MNLTLRADRTSDERSVACRQLKHSVCRTMRDVGYTPLYYLLVQNAVSRVRQKPLLSDGLAMYFTHTFTNKRRSGGLLTGLRHLASLRAGLRFEYH